MRDLPAYEKNVEQNFTSATEPEEESLSHWGCQKGPFIVQKKEESKWNQELSKYYLSHDSKMVRVTKITCLSIPVCVDPLRMYAMNKGLRAGFFSSDILEREVDPQST